MRLLVLERWWRHWHGRARSLLQTRERLLHSTVENSDFNMAGYAFEPVRDMPVVSDCHPVERDQFQAPAPPSVVWVWLVCVWVLPEHGHCHWIGLLPRGPGQPWPSNGGIRLHNHAQGISDAVRRERGFGSGHALSKGRPSGDTGAPHK